MIELFLMNPTVPFSISSIPGMFFWCCFFGTSNQVIPFLSPLVILFVRYYQFFHVNVQNVCNLRFPMTTFSKYRVKRLIIVVNRSVNYVLQNEKEHHLTFIKILYI